MPDSPMLHALEAARQAGAAGEVPVGAAVMRGPDLVALSGNLTRDPPDPTGHAELRALRRAATVLGRERLEECDLWVTLEPCAMCAGAIAHARIRRLYWGASDPKGGAVEHGPRLFAQPTTHHRPQLYGGLMEAECARLLTDFFQTKRAGPIG